MSKNISAKSGGGRGGAGMGVAVFSGRGGAIRRGRGGASDTQSLDGAFEPYVEKEVWSQRHKLWRKFETKLPRMPEEGETMEGASRWVSKREHMPILTSAFLGNHNDGCIKALRSFKDTFENEKVLPDLVIISGPSGAGKSAVLKVFLQELCGVGKISFNDINKWIFFADASEYMKDFTSLFTKLSKFNDSTVEKSIPFTYRIVAIDNIDLVPASIQQQMLKKIMEISFLKARYFLIKQDTSKLIGYIMSKALVINMKQAHVKIALTVVLNVLAKNRIGYDRFGVKEVFKAVEQAGNGISISKIIDMCQSIFLAKQFISAENALKFNNPGKDIEALRPLEVSSIQVLMPIERCKICTLVPPCKHVKLDKLNRMGIKRLRDLPKRKDGLICPTYARYGYCAIYNKYQHCSLDHPKNLHVIVDPPKRCPICTILWPCMHCKYTPFREQYIRDIKDIHERIKRLRLLIEPDAPINIVDYMNYTFGIDHWQSHLRSINSLYVIQENLTMLSDAENWLREAFSTDIEEFTVRDRVLRRAFAELFKTPMLRDLTAEVTQFVKMQQDKLHNEGNNEDSETGHIDGDAGGGTRPSTTSSRAQSEPNDE